MSHFESISFEKEIVRHMYDIALYKAQLSINSTGFSDPSEARARVVAIDENDQILGLSFFRNTSGKTVRLSSGQLYISTNVNGVQYRFTSHIVPTEVINAAYGIRFPRSLQYLQRRNYYRVNVERNSAFANIQTEEYSIDAEIIDISATGLRIRTLNAPSLAVERGDQIPIVNVTLAKVGEISFSAIARFVKKEEKGKYVLGLEIKQISNIHQVIVERYIAQRDRELRKKVVGS